LNSGAGKAGDGCQSIYGEPECGDGLACLSTTNGQGVCTPFCDPSNPAHACPGNAMCEPAEFAMGGAVVHLCAVAATQNDAGAEGGAQDGGDAAADSATDAPSDATGQ
jgi:hypothetical protein